jgi:uncharacterized membrane protein YuzA (DUF378 family)
MENLLKLDFLPTYDYKVKVFGVIILVLSLLLLVFSVNLNIDNAVISWLIAFSLSIISFSKDKNYSSKDIFFKYYALKLSLTFIIGFTLALNLIGYIFSKEIEINLIYFLIGILLIYQTSYNLLKFFSKKRQIEIVEKSFLETLINNSKLYSILLILSFLTILIYYLV